MRRKYVVIWRKWVLVCNVCWAMSIIENHKKEAISYHAFCLLASQDWLNTGTTKYDYGVDTSIHEVGFNSEGKRVAQNGWSLDIQIKSTSDSHITDNGDTISYNLRVQNYNDMIQRNIDNAPTPLILILYIWRDDVSEWVKASNAEEIITQKCLYYYVTSGSKLSQNASTQSIQIPKSHLVTNLTLASLFSTYKEWKNLI